MKYSLVLFILIILCTMPVPGSQDHLINIGKNARTVHNPGQPLYGTFQPEIEENILFSEAADFLIGDICDIAINGEGKLFMSDYRQVYCISPNEKSIKKIGGPGPGPGEYSYPAVFCFGQNDDLFVQDSYRIHHYDGTGKFLEHIAILFKSSYRQGTFYVDFIGNLYGLKTRFLNNTLQVELNKFNSKGRYIKTFAVFNEESSSVNRARGGGFIRSSVYHEYMEDVYFVPVLNSQLCFGRNTDYKLYISDLEGNVDKVIDVAETSWKINSSELKIFRDKYGEDFRELKFPATRPFFRSLLSDEKGRIYVVRVNPVGPEKKNVTMDIFNKYGQYFYRVSLRYFPEIIKNGMVYVIDRNDPDCLKIKKLIIKNYSALKF